MDDDHLAKHFEKNTVLCLQAIAALKAGFEKEAGTDLILGELTKPTCRFSNLGDLLSALGGLYTAVARCRTNPLLLKALFMVASRDHRCRSEVWDLVKIGLTTIADTDLDMWKVCFQASMVKLSTMPVHLYLELGLAILRHGKALVRHCLDSAMVVLTFLLFIKPKVDYFFPPTSHRSAEKEIADIVGVSLTLYLTSGPKLFVTAVMDVCLGIPAAVDRPSLLKGILLEDRWQELCKSPSYDNLCLLLHNAMPMVFLEGHRGVSFLYTHENLHEVVDAWACLLRAAPLHVTHAWIYGCCERYPCWLGEAVLLRLLGLAQGDDRPCTSCGNVRFQVLKCIQAVRASFIHRSERSNVPMRKGTDSVWADLATRAVGKTWALNSSSPSYVAAAMNLLGAAVYMCTAAFVRAPYVVDFVLHAFRTMPLSPGAVLCARNGLVSLDGTPALPRFQDAVKTFVTSMADNRFAGLRSLPRSVLVDFVWALCVLQQGTPASVDEDMASGLFSLRMLHSLLQCVSIDYLAKGVMEAVGEVLAKLPAARDLGHASLVLQIVVCLHSSHLDALRHLSTIPRDTLLLPTILHLLDHFAEALSETPGKDGLQEACVHPTDHEWNVQLFCLLFRNCEDQGRLLWMPWVYRLIPSIASPDSLPKTAIMSRTLRLLVESQLVRAWFFFEPLFLGDFFFENVRMYMCLSFQAMVSENFSGLRKVWIAAAVLL